MMGLDMTAEMALSLGDSYFVDEDYESAINEYASALSLLGPESSIVRTRALSHRSAAYYNMNRNTEALVDAQAAISVQHIDGIRVGERELFHKRAALAALRLKRYTHALKSFECAKELAIKSGRDATAYDEWVQECAQQLTPSVTSSTSPPSSVVASDSAASSLVLPPDTTIVRSVPVASVPSVAALSQSKSAPSGEIHVLSSAREGDGSVGSVGSVLVESKRPPTEQTAPSTLVISEEETSIDLKKAVAPPETVTAVVESKSAPSKEVTIPMSPLTPESGMPTDKTKETTTTTASTSVDVKGAAPFDLSSSMKDDDPASIEKKSPTSKKATFAAPVSSTTTFSAQLPSARIPSRTLPTARAPLPSASIPPPPQRAYQRSLSTPVSHSKGSTTRPSLKKTRNQPNYVLRQTESVLMISVEEKNLKPQDVQVDFKPTELKIILKKGDSDVPILSGTLYDEIIVERCQIRFSDDYVFIQLQKKEVGMWPTVIVESEEKSAPRRHAHSEPPPRRQSASNLDIQAIQQRLAAHQARKSSARRSKRDKEDIRVRLEGQEEGRGAAHSPPASPKRKGEEKLKQKSEKKPPVRDVSLKIKPDRTKDSRSGDSAVAAKPDIPSKPSLDKAMFKHEKEKSFGEAYDKTLAQHRKEESITKSESRKTGLRKFWSSTRLSRRDTFKERGTAEGDLNTASRPRRGSAPPRRRSSRAPKYEYYQTDSVMMVAIDEPNLKPKDLVVNFDPKRLKIMLTKRGMEYVIFNGPLFAEVAVSRCRVLYSDDKVLITLHKKEAGDWKALVAPGEAG